MSQQNQPTTFCKAYKLYRMVFTFLSGWEKHQKKYISRRENYLKTPVSVFINKVMLGHSNREFQKNISFCFIDYAKAFECVDHNKLWKILKEMGIPDHLTCLLRNVYQVRKQQLELDMEQQTGSKEEKEFIKAIYCHPAYLTYVQSTS